MKAIIDAEDFKRIINNTKKFTRNYDNRMSYIRLEVDTEKNIIKASALDGHRVSVEYAPIKQADCSFKCFVKANIPKITKKDRAVDLELVGNKCYVTVNEYITGFKQPECEWFDTDKYIKDTLSKPVKESICVNPKLLKEALDSVGDLVCFSGVKIELRDKKDPIVIIPRASIFKDNIKLVLPVAGPEEV